MEKTTCTLKVVSGKREGFLYILDGDLISAETEGLANLDAACAIISWEDTVIEIENTCAKTENEINQPLMHVLMEGLKLKDEKADIEPDDGIEATVPSDQEPLEIILEDETADAAEDDAEDEPDIADEAEGAPELQPAGGRDISRTGDDFELHVAPKEKGGLPKVPLILGIVILAAAVVYFTVLSPDTESLEQAYQDTLAQVELTDDINEQVQLLQGFIETAGEESEWAQAAYRKIDELKTAHENVAFMQVSARAEDLAASKAYMQAAGLYEKHLRLFPDSPNAGEARASITKLTTLAEQTDYKAVTTARAAGGIDRIDAYRHYVRQHPKGPKFAEVQAMIDAMEAEYFMHTEKQIAKSAMAEDWVNCTRLVEKYTAIYPETSNAAKLNKFLPLFEKNRLEYADYEKLLKTAHAAGTDYAKAQKVLAGYLKKYPGTHLEKKIQDQIARYKKMDEETKINKRTARLEALLLKSGGRFVSNGNGTFTDKRTGLMWCTLDSKSVLDNCLNFESAQAYIKALNTGGHGDWRMPAPGELKTLLKVEPFFPATPNEWLWTSRILKKYVGEWLIDVTILTADNKPSPGMVKDSRYCGNVRAVRRP